MNAPEQVRATLLLCDAGQVVADKLYILGGGWSYLFLPAAGMPAAFALAIDLAVPWNFGNRKLDFLAQLLTEDEEAVMAEFVPGDEQPVRAEGPIIAGRAPTARPGTDLHVPLVIPFGPLPLDPGGYVCEVKIDGDPVGRAGFQVVVVGQ